jgi:lipoate---protein ligase
VNRWRYIADHDVGGANGLALDEALMAGHGRGQLAAPVLRLYTYASHVALCGRYQHIEAEVDLEACRRTGTDVGRRPTGGGAIVMGEGQLGVAVVTTAPTAERPKDLLERFSLGIVAGLAKLGIDARFAGKNDLKVDGRKIAGLGLYLDGAGALLFHSSILADLDIPFMLKVLNVPAAKLGASGPAAVAERVTTVSRETRQSWTGASVREVVALGFCEALGIELAESTPTVAEIARATDLVTSKYATDEWRFQRSPQADTNSSSMIKTPGGLVRVYVALQGDTIKSAMFTGDFNEMPAPLAEYESVLKWARADPEALAVLARRTCGDDTGLGVPPEQLAAAVWQAAEQAMRHGVAAPLIEGSCYFPEPGGAHS